MDSFSLISGAAHEGAAGINGLRPPTAEQARSGNYRKGRCTLHGLRIAIETPQGQRRTGKTDGEPWSVICMAHYGYIEKTRGADGDEIDVFIGPWPESTMVYVVNRVGERGGFDEHKLLLGFADQESAVTAYRNSYKPGAAGVASVVPCTIDQLKWWITYGDHSRPLTPNQLPYDRTATMNDIAWDSAAQPLTTSLPNLMYALRRQDSGHDLLLDAVTVADVLEASDGEAVLDALVVPLNRMERKLAQMQVIMRAASKEVRPVAMQVTPPFKQRGTTNVAVIFEMSDGQSVSVYFHNPDTTPNKLTPDDEMVSWKWMLNKKDVTIVVAPERGQDLNPREVARRIMRLVESNSKRFQAVNARRGERMQAIEAGKASVAAKEAELAALEAEVTVLRERVAVKRAKPPAVLQTSGGEEKGDIAPSTDTRLAEVREFLGRRGWNVKPGRLEMTVNIDGSLYGIIANATNSTLEWADTGSVRVWMNDSTLSSEDMAVKIDSEFRAAVANAKAKLLRSGSPEEQAAADAALAMAAKVVAELGGTFTADGFSGAGVAGAWSYGRARVNSVDLRLAASGGGVVQVNRNPHDPDGAVNTAPDQVRRSILAVAPERNAEPTIEGNNDEVVAILKPHVPALLAALRARQPFWENVDSIKVEVLGYFDLSISAIDAGSSTGIAFVEGANYTMVAKIIGAEDAAKIKAIIDDLKASAADRKASGYWKERPFNKIEKVVLRWSENSMDSDREFADLDDLQDWFRTTYRSDEVRPAGTTYSKNSIRVTLSNIDGDTFNIEPRLDVSASEHDFNPYRETVAEYLRRIGYDGETPRKAGKEEMYVDIPLSAAAGNSAGDDPDPIRSGAIAALELAGWSPGEGSALATKAFKSVNGEEQALAFLDQGDGYNRTLSFEFTSEGRNVPAADLALIPVAASREEAKSLVAQAAERAEKSIRDSYGVRMVAGEEEDPVLAEAVRLVREAKGGIGKLATSDYFTFEFEGDDLIFNDELRAQVEAALGEKVKEVVLPGLELQTSIVPASFSQTDADPFAEADKELVALGLKRVQNNDWASAAIPQENGISKRINVRAFGDPISYRISATISKPGITGAQKVVGTYKSIPDLMSAIRKELPQSVVPGEVAAYLQSVIDGTADLSDPAVADRLTELYEAHNGNAEFDDMFAKAADAYQAFMVEAAKKAMGG